MTARSKPIEVYPSVQKIYQERLPDNVTAIQTAIALVRKEFASSRKLKYYEVIIGLGLSDLSEFYRSYRLYMDPTGTGKHRLYGYRGNTIMTIHFISQDQSKALEEYRRGVREKKEIIKRQKTDDRL